MKRRRISEDQPSAQPTDTTTNDAPIPSCSTRRTAAPDIQTTVRAPPETPSKRKTRAGDLANGEDDEPTVSPSPRKNLFTTPRKTNRVRFAHSDVSPPPIVTNADQSARRKSVRRMVLKPLNGGDVSGEDDEEEEELARRIYSDSEDESGSGEDDEEMTAGSPQKAKPGRPPKAKASAKKKRDTTPPPPSYEGVDSYFHQNRKARQQTSTATLASLPNLDHSTYFQLLRSHPIDHPEDCERLTLIHEDSIDQWVFELSEGFNILLYGYGSKRKLLTTVAGRLYTVPGSVVVINGYLPSLTIKDILTTISSALLANPESVRLGPTPNEILENIISLLDEPNAQKLSLIIHNLDGEALRAERTQTVIARLAAHPKISLVASVDHIRAPLLWDAARVSQLNFLWHDATTFEPYAVEIPADDALALVDGAGRAGGTKGVKYVLASLPSNAKALFRVLVNHQIQAMVDDSGAGEKKGTEEYGIEYRVLYQRAVLEFICSNDVAFRTLLKEFQDHQMVTSRKDAQGTEVLWAPFRKDDLESILDDLV